MDRKMLVAVAHYRDGNEFACFTQTPNWEDPPDLNETGKNWCLEHLKQPECYEARLFRVEEEIPLMASPDKVSPL